MKRRSFFNKTTTALMGLGLTTSSFANTTNKKITLPAKVCTTIDQQKVFFYADVINESIKVIYIADTHLFKDDNRGVPYQEYSNRMANAYNQTTHFLTLKKTNPEEAFEQTLAHAKELNADVIATIALPYSFSLRTQSSNQVSLGANSPAPEDVYSFLKVVETPAFSTIFLILCTRK